MALRDKPDTIIYETRPKLLKHPVNGRVFIATDHLIARGDMIAVDNLDEEEAIKEFNPGKATKQQIIDMAKEKFGAGLQLSSTLKVLRDLYAELEADCAELEAKNASNNPDSPVS